VLDSEDPKGYASMIFSRAVRRGLVAVAVVLVGLYLLLPPLSRTAAFRTQVQRALASAAGMDVVLARIAVGYDLSIAAGDVSVAAPQQQPFFRARHVEVGLAPWTLLTGRAAMVRIDEPHLFVDHLPPSSAAAGGAFPFGALQLANGFVHWTAAQGDIVVGPVSVSVDSLRTSPTLSLHGRSEMALATLAQQVKLPGMAEGTVEVTAELSGALRDMQGSGLLLVREGRWQSDGEMLSADLELPFELRGATLKLGQRGQKIGSLAGSVRGLGWQVKQAELSGTIEKKADGLSGTAEIALANIEFHDADHVRAGEKLRVAGWFEITQGPSDQLSVRADLGLQQGEILWHRFYADLKDHPITIRGELRGVPGDMQMRDVVLGAGGIGSVTLSGRYTGSGPSTVRARVDVGGLERLYALAVRDALQETYPFLARTEAGGGLSGDVEFKRGKHDWSLTGNLRLADGHASGSDPALEVRGLSIDLPITLGTRTLDTTVRKGSLRVAALRLGGVEIPATEAALSVVPNAVRLAEPLSVPVLGGAFVLNEIEALHLAGSTPQVNLGFALREMDLGRLSQALGGPPLRGTMGGEASEVRIENGEIRSEGEIRVQVFGGEVRARNVRVTQILSSVPTLDLDVSFEDILLDDVTETLDIGRISGVARGAAHDLAIVHGQPLRFDAWMETVPRRGVAQRISVKAIGQLSMIGGSGGDPLSQAVLSFFDEYRYAKLGFRCRLENDRFLLHGIEQRDGKDYLVVGSSIPPRVNVISHSQEIAFSEMVRRISRVTAEQTGAAERRE
jgi:hypothetical protein